MSLRLQGLAFSLLAWLTLIVCLWLPPQGTQLQLAVLAPVILLLGVPHGALDVVFVRQLARVRSAAAWSLFTAGYMAAAASVVGLWWYAPGAFLSAFLLVSVLHFSGDPEGETPALFRLLYGGAIVFCPLALHASEVTRLFASLAGEPAATAIVGALHWAAWPWVAAIVGAATVCAGRGSDASSASSASHAPGAARAPGSKPAPARSIELVSMAALLIVAPPLIGFTIFFCGMHSARHLLRTRAYSDAGTFRHLLHIAAGPMLATLGGIGIAWWLSEGKPLDMRLAQLLFVGLAALTVPHMIVVERVRFSGWVMGRSPLREWSSPR